MAFENLSVSSYRQWQKSMFAETLRGHNRYKLYYASARLIAGALAAVPSEQRLGLIPKYIRIITDITRAINDERDRGQKQGIEYILASDDHSRIWIIQKTLDAIYELLEEGEDEQARR